ncbi:hypothetical protein GCM10009609_27370 [Pseudonocardia aurantiaca]
MPGGGPDRDDDGAEHRERDEDDNRVHDEHVDGESGYERGHGAPFAGIRIRVIVSVPPQRILGPGPRGTPRARAGTALTQEAQTIFGPSADAGSRSRNAAPGPS